MKQKTDWSNLIASLHYIQFKDIDNIQFLARGGYGIVHKGTWLHQPVVLKQLEFYGDEDDFYKEVCII